MTNIATMREKAEATKKVNDYIRDLLSLKITLPLGNPNLKLVHTNQFCWTELPKDTFDLANFEVIAKALQSTESRFSQYEINRWYIEGLSISNDGDSFRMELDLNPFPTTLAKFRDEKQGFTKAYTDALSQLNSKTSAKSVKSVSNGNSSLKGGEGKTIDNLVKKIVKKETDELKKAKAIHKWLQTNVSYKFYRDSKYHTPNNCYKNRSHLNCADTSILTSSMMRSAGINCYIVHGGSGSNGHYWTLLRINNKDYHSDATSHQRGFNKIWLNLKVNRKCGDSPC